MHLLITQLPPGSTMYQPTVDLAHVCMCFVAAQLKVHIVFSIDMVLCVLKGTNSSEHTTTKKQNTKNRKTNRPGAPSERLMELAL